MPDPLVLTLNGGSAKVKGTSLELTSNGGFQVASAFSTNKVDVTQFVTQFAFQVLNPETVVKFRKVEVKELPPGGP